MVEVQSKAPVLLVTVQPVEALPPPRRMSPVLVAPMDTVPVVAPSSVKFLAAPPAEMASPAVPSPEIAVPETLRLSTLVAVWVPPDTVPPLRVPAEIVAPLMVELQASAPVELVTVQPVEPEPPPRTMSPVEVAPMLTVPVVAASRVIF
jgi:hypothetical protein